VCIADRRAAERGHAQAKPEAAHAQERRFGANATGNRHFAAGRKCVMGTILFLTGSTNGEAQNTIHGMLDELPAKPETECIDAECIDTESVGVESIDEGEGEGYVSEDPDIWLYRDRTIALLRRYFRISIEVGRLPSLVGREVFRSRVTAYRIRTFEDAVIFVHDVERGLGQLDDFERKLIAKIVFQEYTQDEAARLLGCWRRTVGRRFPESVDRLSEIFLEGGLLSRLPVRAKKPPQSCQEAEIGEKLVSASMCGK
jgi:hypothetical protein